MKIEKFKPYTAKSVIDSPYWNKLPYELQEALVVVSKVLPFRTNEYVLRELIDWSRVPDDPIFRLTFPHPNMLLAEEYEELRDLSIEKKDEAAAARVVSRIRHRMNPHPAGQLTHNVPMLNGNPVRGIQHKYSETVLFFPAAGQTCHAYCTFCFRWPQFGERTRPHAHSWWHLFFVRAGSARAVLKSHASRALAEGDLLLVPAWTDHHFENDSPKDLVLLSMSNLPQQAPCPTTVRRSRKRSTRE